MNYKTALLLTCALFFSGYAHADDATSASDLGYSAIQQGDWAKAELQLRAELKANPSDPMRMLNLAYVLQSQGRADEAATLYQSVLELDQDPLVAIGSESKPRPMRAKLVAKKAINTMASDL